MKKHKLLYFKNELEEHHFSNNKTSKGFYNGIPISLNFPEFSDFEENITKINHFLENLELVFEKITKRLHENPTEIKDFVQYLHDSKKITSYQNFVEKATPARISIYFYGSLTFHITLAINDEEIYTTISDDLQVNRFFCAWGGVSILQSKMITYPSEKLLEFDCESYEYIDNLNFTINPDDILENTKEYINIAKKRFTEIGWEGDGAIKLIWIPPFMLKSELGDILYMGRDRTYETEGIIIWHVKQSSDGISYLLFPKELLQHIDFYTQGSGSPVIIEELGKINGQNAISLVDFQFTANELILKGNLNGLLCKNIEEEKDIPYEVAFKNVLHFSSTEVDFYNMKKYSSCFDKFYYSKKIAEFKKQNNPKLTENHQHFVFYTYDLVFEIIADGFELKLI